MRMMPRDEHTILEDREALDQFIDEILRQFPPEELDRDRVGARFPNLDANVWKELELAAAIRRAQRWAEIPLEEADVDADLILSNEELEYLQQQINGYLFVQPLGHGGQGSVYEAVQESTGRTVAIKLLRDGPLASASKRQRFHREVNFISGLRHPNIAQVYDSGALQGHCWYTMECIPDAASITDYVLMRQLDVRGVVELIIVVAQAVGYAHQQGVLHRDLKPSNILVDRNGIPRIVDFGLARELGGARNDLTETGQVVGTLNYLSPEQLDKRRIAPDIRADVYALGVVLFQLLSGGFPHDRAQSQIEVHERIVKGDLETLRVVRRRNQASETLTPAGDVNEDLDRVVMKALECDADRRYQSMHELAADLQRFLRGEAVLARAQDDWYNVRKTLRRFRKHAAVSAGFVLLLGVSLVVSISLWQRAERVALIAQQALDSGAYNRLGTVARDLGRRDKALELFKKSIEISDVSDIRDPVLMAARFDACYETAWLLYSTGDCRRAEELRLAGDRVLGRARAAFPDDPIWRSKKMRSQVLLGCQSEKAGAPASALEAYGSALRIGQELLTAYPQDIGILRDFGFAHRRIGRVLLQLECHEQALAYYEKGLELSSELSRYSPPTVDDRLDDIRNLGHIARCLGRRRNMADEIAAVEILNQCEQMLENLAAEQPGHGLDKDVLEISNDGAALRDWLLKRVRRRAATEFRS